MGVQPILLVNKLLLVTIDGWVVVNKIMDGLLSLVIACVWEALCRQKKNGVSTDTVLPHTSFLPSSEQLQWSLHLGQRKDRTPKGTQKKSALCYDGCAWILIYCLIWLILTYIHMYSCVFICICILWIPKVIPKVICVGLSSCGWDDGTWDCMPCQFGWSAPGPSCGDDSRQKKPSGSLGLCQFQVPTLVASIPEICCSDPKKGQWHYVTFPAFLPPQKLKNGPASQLLKPEPTGKWHASRNPHPADGRPREFEWRHWIKWVVKNAEQMDSGSTQSFKHLSP